MIILKSQKLIIDNHQSITNNVEIPVKAGTVVNNK